MRASLVLVPLALAAASCSGQQGSQSSRSDESVASNAAGDAAVDASAESRAPAGPPATRETGPDVSPTAAPGVAFNYRYAFRLPAQRIAAVQEQHAALCEQLGPNRCRITGMLYRVHNERDVEARLTFKLEPSIARRFGREGVEAVTRADGLLIESAITGTDVGTSIRRAGRSIDEMNEELRRIEARLAGRLGSGERSNLEYEAQQLRAQIRAARENREEQQESLATTPMTFDYGAGRSVPGPEPRRPFGETLEDARDNFLDGLSVLFVIAVTLLPWALIGILAWFVVRWARRRFVRPREAAPEVETAAPA